MLFHATQLAAEPLIKNCADDAPRFKCGDWSVGGYYSVSPDGYWFGGIYAGGEYFLLNNFSAGASLSPGFGDGYFYLAPSVEANYYFWQSGRFEMIAGYSFRYFYDWPLKKNDAESSGTFHGPGISAMYGLTDALYAGGNISYQWVRFGGETLREWYFTLPVVWIL
jgi:hypothetical protein